MGTKAEVGHLIYTVFETQWLTHIGAATGGRVPERRFFLVRVSVVNSGAAEAMVPTMTLLGDDGQTYTELSNGEGVPKWIGFLRKVRPAESLQGNVVFDVNPAHYKLRVTDETEQRAAFIDIPLTFGSETPDLPVPQATDAR